MYDKKIAKGDTSAQVYAQSVRLPFTNDPVAQAYEQKVRVAFENNGMLKMPAVIAFTSIGRSTLFQMIKDGKFPKPVKTGKNAVAWRAAAVLAYVNSLGG